MEGRSINEQKLEIFNRRRFDINDCIEVHNFNDEVVVLETSLGLLTVNGEQLKIEKLNLESGEISLNGNIYALNFEDEVGFMDKSSGFFAKLFK